MRVLVTGCAGFIGWKVSEGLLQEGHSVVGADNLNNAYDPRLKEWRLAQLHNRPNFQFYRLDIADRNALRVLVPDSSAPADPPFNAVVNLAARAGVRQSVENPWVYLQTNVIGTLNLLELCRELGVEKFVQASTSSLYGARNPQPFREDADTDKPLSPYAASKKAAEALCYTYHHLHGIDITVLRYFTVYGPAGRPDMSVFRFVQWISEGRPVTVFGDGQQSRDFTYVEDIARGTIAGLKPLGYGVANLGSDRPVKLLQMIQLLEGLLGHKAQLQYAPRHSADVPATWADINEARRLLEWEPRVSLESGLEQSVSWYLENRAWARNIQTG